MHSFLHVLINMSESATVTQPHGAGHWEGNKRTGLSLARRWIGCCADVVVVVVDDDDDNDNDACKNMKKKKKERFILKGRRLPEGCYL